MCYDQICIQSYLSLVQVSNYSTFFCFGSNFDDVYYPRFTSYIFSTSSSFMFRCLFFSCSHQAEIQALSHAMHIHQTQMRMILQHLLEIWGDLIKHQGGDYPALKILLLMVNLWKWSIATLACFIVLLDAPIVLYVTIVWKGLITIALGLDSALERYEMKLTILTVKTRLNFGRTIRYIRLY